MLEIGDHVVIGLIQRDGKADLAVELGELGISISTTVTPCAFTFAIAAWNAASVSASRLVSIDLTMPIRTCFRSAGVTASPPAMTRSSSATSAMVAAIGPAVSRVCEIGAMPACG